MSNIVSYISDLVTELINSALTKITSTVSNILNSISTTIENVFDYFVDLFNTFTAFIDRVSEQFFDFISDSFDSFVEYIEEMFLSAVAYFEDVVDYVIEAIDDFIQPIAEEIESLFYSISENVDSLFNSVSETIDEGITATYEAINAVAVEFSETADELADELAEITGGVLDELDQFSALVRDNIGQPFADLLDRLSNSWFMQDEQSIKQSAIETSSDTGDPYENLARYVNGEISYSDLMFDPKVKTSVFGLLLVGFQAIMAKGMMGLQAVQLANSAKVTKLIQDVWSSMPIQEFSFPEAVSIHVRGFLTEDQAQQAAEKGGFDSQHFKVAKQAAETPLEPEKATAAYFRGLIDEVSYKSYLQRQGFNETDQEVYRRTAVVHPPVQDLITMAVREVFSPAIAEQFKLFGDLPDEFVKEAEKGGLTKEWAEKYWGAHWRLPSAGQGFEMYHRGFITEDQLDMLIKALDVSPFWRGPLKAIAYHPVTRVDIRRMLKLGVIDRDEAYRRYADLGYSPNDAELMTQFAESLLPDAELEDEIDFRELTQSQVRTLYNQGTYSKSEAIEKMIESGYSEDAAYLLVGSWQAAIMIREREELLNMIISKAIREHLTVNQIESTTFNLQLTSEERERIEREVLLRGRNFTSIPSKTELLKMYQAEIISGKEWYDTMMMHNYSEYWVGNYAKLMGVNIG